MALCPHAFDNDRRGSCSRWSSLTYIRIYIYKPPSIIYTVLRCASSSTSSSYTCPPFFLFLLYFPLKSRSHSIYTSVFAVLSDTSWKIISEGGEILPINNHIQIQSHLIHTHTHAGLFFFNVKLVVERKKRKKIRRSAQSECCRCSSFHRGVTAPPDPDVYI